MFLGQDRSSFHTPKAGSRCAIDCKSSLIFPQGNFLITRSHINDNANFLEVLVNPYNFIKSANILKDLFEEKVIIQS